MPTLRSKHVVALASVRGKHRVCTYNETRQNPRPEASSAANDSSVCGRPRIQQSKFPVDSSVITCSATRPAERCRQCGYDTGD